MKPLWCFWFLVGLIAASSSAEAQTLKEPGRVLSEKVTGVADGDTLRLEDGREAQLIGVDCAELQLTSEDNFKVVENKLSQPDYASQGQKARDYAEEFIKRPNLRLVADSQHDDAGNQDHLNRTLVYVYAGPEMLNATLLQQGLCLREVEIRYTYLEEFRQYEDSAKQAKKGIWEKAS